MTKLTNEIKDKILELETKGMSRADIARELELNANTVQSFLYKQRNPTFTLK